MKKKREKQPTLPMPQVSSIWENQCFNKAGALSDCIV